VNTARLFENTTVCLEYEGAFEVYSWTKLWKVHLLCDAIGLKFSWCHHELSLFNLRILKTGFLNLPDNTDPLYNLINSAEPFPKICLESRPVHHTCRQC